NKIVAKVELPANQQISANENAAKNNQEKIETKTGPGDGTEESQSNIKDNDVESKEKTNTTVKETKERGNKSSIPTIDLFLPNANSESRDKPVTHIVMHFTSNAAISPKNPYDVQEIHKTFIDYGVSAHYLIGRDGQIYQMVPEERVAYHAGKGHLEQLPQYKDHLNHYSIGIEVMAIGTKEEMGAMMEDSFYDSIPKSYIGYTEAQYQAIRHLIDDIVTRNPGIKKSRNHIIGQDEYAPERKTDPGSLFDWSKIGIRSEEHT